MDVKERCQKIALKIDHRITVAIDLDGVIAKYTGWKGGHIIEDPNPEGVKLCQMMRDAGWKIVIYTCRTNRSWPSQYDYDQVKINILAWLYKHQVPFDEVYDAWGKPYADAYVDDRGVYFPSNAGNAMEVMSSIVSMLEECSKDNAPLPNGGQREINSAIHDREWTHNENK